MSGRPALIAAALLVAAPAFAQEAKAPEPVVVESAFDPVTKIDGEVLQVIFGEQAVISLAENGAPTLVSSEKGKLAVAHPEGEVTETFVAPTSGAIAFALDGSAEKRASYLKVWNSLDYPVSYRVILVTYKQGKLVPTPGRACAAPARASRYDIWPAPVVAVAISKFARAANDKACG